MRVTRFLPAFPFILLVMMCSSAFAQQATISGTITDESKAVLPGVTVTATDLAKGTQVVAVSDAHGEYRLLQLTPSAYKVRADLPGFTSTIIEKMDLRVGQNATASLILKVAAIAESVTVTGESPLVDTRSMQVAGNVNPTQM